MARLRSRSGNSAGMKRAAAITGLLFLGFLVPGCGGRAPIERHLVFVRATAPENPLYGPFPERAGGAGRAADPTVCAVGACVTA